MKYIKTFETHSEYTQYVESEEFKLPNVSYCKDIVDEVHFTPIPHDYTKDYLTFEALEDGDIILYYRSLAPNLSIGYRKNGGNWSTNNSGDNGNRTIGSVKKGDKIEVYANLVYTDEYNDAIDAYFKITTRVNVSGNLLSLYWGNNFKTHDEFPPGRYSGGKSAYQLFKDCAIVDASGLIIPSQLRNYCCQGMFLNCTLLTKAPSVLPADTLVNGCYDGMFSGCTSLTTAPELPATTLYTNCYKNLFNGCTSLTTPPSILPAMSLQSGCYWNMFSGCTSLTTVPSNLLPATTLVSDCYLGMFQGCTSLTRVPDLPAEELASSCYNGMFSGCTALTTIPSNLLPATTLTNLTSCYQSMFSGCTALTTAPELPATKLASSCYKEMFKGCRRLTISPELPATSLYDSCYHSMFYGTKALPDCTNIDFTTTGNGGFKGLFAGTKVTDENLYNILPLSYNSEADEDEYCLPAFNLVSSCYEYMFQDCTLLQKAPRLPSKIIANSCYSHMFEGCTSLIIPPELPATTLVSYCYQYMFKGCTSLTTAPELPARTFPETYSYCYNYMFQGCSSLNYIKALLTATPGTTYTNSWVDGVAATGTFVKNPKATWTSTGISSVPSGWTIEIDWDENSEWFTTKAIDDSVFTLTIGSNVTPSYLSRVSYSLDDGETWVSTNNVSSQTVTVTTPEVEAGDEVKWRCIGSAMGTSDTTTTTASYRSIFSSTGRYEISGDITTLTSGTKRTTTSTYNCLFYGSTNLISSENLILPTSVGTYSYRNIFYGCTALTTPPTTLPATTLASYCYANMFYGCSSLTTTPTLPATTLAEGCYNSMFRECTSLTTAPSLNATTLAASCYYSMFYGCSGLTTAPSLNATTLANQCYMFMFWGCTALTSAPALNATTLMTSCYENMFYGCTSLATAPTLGATTLAQWCYRNMFNRCSALTTAPILGVTTLASGCYESMFYNCTGLTTVPSNMLPATTLASDCYKEMFRGCTSLTTAPILPAETLASTCYSNMFNGCSSLNYIKALFIIKADGSTDNWVSGVASTGTFVQNGSALWYSFGVSGIPTNWTLQYDGDSTIAQNYITGLGTGYLCFEALEDSVFTLTMPSYVTTSYMTSVSYSLDNCQTWTTTNNTSSSVTITTPTVATGNKVYWKGVGSRLCAVSTTNGRSSTFGSTGQFNVSGTLMSMLRGNDDYMDGIGGNTYSFYGLFKANTKVTSVQDLILPRVAYDYSFGLMFQGCTALTTVPSVLPATRLGANCYNSMFNGCTALTTVPSNLLPATTLATYCYSNMFYGCTSLTTTPVLPATTLATYCYNSMFYGCTSLTTVPSNLLPATTLVNYCYQYMFTGCTALTTAPELPARTLASGCYNYMFQNCSSLNYIKAMFTTTPYTTYTYNWVSGVAATGTFVKNSAATWTTTGTYGAPTGWTIQKVSS